MGVIGSHRPPTDGDLPLRLGRAHDLEHDDAVTLHIVRRVRVGERAEAILLEEDIPEGMIWEAARRGVISLKLCPVFCGSAYKNRGVQPLLDGIVDFEDRCRYHRPERCRIDRFEVSTPCGQRRE